MMKKFLISFVIVLATLVGGSALNVGTTAQAATTKYRTVKATPKKMRGTWYQYMGKKDGMYKLVIKKHQVTSRFGNQSKYTLPSLTITKWSQKGKRAVYNFNSKTHPADTASYFTMTMKIRGKKRTVIASPQQDPSLKPVVFTHFKTKHQYFAPLSIQKHLAF
ncbi:hypothetical protein [Levilactobacillus wangkuiensis]|uniref:hypothetical protein n=1 Tax=Levilactobacillus wangkuiensis TaxID=2799566 RepID=UPI001944D03B|nr:hypothetical protein [Levilactobacillus wangkuiensis]